MTMYFFPIFVPYDETEKQPFESVIKVPKNSFDKLKSAVLNTLKDLGYNNPVFYNSGFYEERKTPSFTAFAFSWILTFFVDLILLLFCLNHTIEEAILLLALFPFLISCVISIIHFLTCPLKEIEVLQLDNTKDFYYLSIITKSKAYNLILFDSIKKELSEQ